MVFVQQHKAQDDPALEADRSSLKEVPMTSAHPAAGETEITAVSQEEKQQARLSAKANLKALLQEHNRSAKHPDVVQAIEELQTLNPTEDAALDPNIEGDFHSLTKPAFPGRLKQDPDNDHIDQYTLGRMSFNIFQPKDLVCTIRKIGNTVKRVLEGESKDDSQIRSYEYPLVTEMIVHTPKGDFPAVLRMDAQCSNEKQPKNRLGVTFVGGTMCPSYEVRSNLTKLAQWKEVFANAYKKAEEERSYLSAVMNYTFKWMFKLSTPSDEEAMKNDYAAVHFEMKRCPHGYFDVLYLDEDLRITRGNRGTVVIAERDGFRN